tara:strand:+ start:119719 stop:120798 length:1080 start_codon:yes stop_codon:yes gene_type:complete
MSDSASIETEHKAEADEFNSSAMEGWSNSDLEVNASMKNVDERMKDYFNQDSTQGQSTGIYLFLGLFSLIMIVLIVYTYQGNQITKETIAEKTKIPPSDSKSDLTKNNKIDKPVNEKIAAIEDYEPIDKNEQITKEQLRNQPQETSSVNADNNRIENSAADQNKIVQLDPKQITEIPTGEAENLTFTMASEVYLNGLKTVDYRSIRTDEPIELLQELPMGTPADQSERMENEGSETEILIKEVKYIDYLDETQRLFMNESFKKSLRRYLIIIDHYPDDVNAHFYSGLCYYNLGKYDQAIDHFNNSYSLQIGNFKQEAEWFKAKAYIQINESSKAKKLLKTIIEEDGFYSEQAAQLLNSL